MASLQIRKHIMTGISYMIPYVCAAGMLMVIGNIFGGQTITDYRAGFSIPDALTWRWIRIITSIYFDFYSIFYCR